MGVGAATVRRLALALPETAEAPHHDMTSSASPGRSSPPCRPRADACHVFLDDVAVAAYCAEFPAAVEELWWGSKRRGCRVVLAKATTPLLRELLTESWRRKAPRRLAGPDG